MARTPQGNPRPAEKPRFTRSQSPRPPFRRAKGPVDERWIWGVHAVAAALGNPKRKLLRKLATETGIEKLREAGAPAASLADLVAVENEAIAALLPPMSVHQGVAVLAEPLEDLDAADIVAAGEGPILVLDQVTDPQNVGAILRSARALAAAGVIVQDRHSPPMAGACAKAATGAVETVPVARVVNIAQALDMLIELGVTPIGLDARASTDLRSAFAGAGRIAIVLGAEDKGLRDKVRATCTHLAAIPIASAAESLNVSVSAAIALYEARLCAQR